jgi:hypothetical protein
MTPKGPPGFCLLVAIVKRPVGVGEYCLPTPTGYDLIGLPLLNNVKRLILMDIVIEYAITSPQFTIFRNKEIATSWWQIKHGRYL